MLPCFKPDVTIELDQEAQNSCDLLGFTHEDIVKIKVRFDDIDIDQTGEIDYTEFLAASIDHRIYMQDRKHNSKIYLV